MGVTRFPNGISFVKPDVTAANTGGFYFAPGDTTPNVANGAYFVTAGSALTITNFDGGQQGQIIIIRSNSQGATTIQNSAGGINTLSLAYTPSAGGVITVGTNTGNIVMGNNEIVMFVHNGTDWSQVGTRVIDSTLD